MLMTMSEPDIVSEAQKDISIIVEVREALADYYNLIMC